MTAAFSILGRGRAGRALAAAWTQAGLEVDLCSATAAPKGLVLLAVPDDVVPALAARFPGRCVHLSGSLHLEDVPCAHPLTSFDGTGGDALAPWDGTPLAVTGEVPAFLVGAFVRLGFQPFALDPRQKALYHAVAVLTSAHSATLWLGAAALLAEAGVVLPGRGLLPLVEATLHNVERLGREGRTGPFVRGDAGTIARDAEALPEAWREVFLKLGHL